MSGFRSPATKVVAIFLVACIFGLGTASSPSASAEITGGPPCCSDPVNFASSVMREYLEELWDEPGDIQVAWLRGRLEGQDYDYVLALRAALAGHCLEGCEPELAVATEALNDIVEQRYHARELRAQYLFGGVGIVWTLVVGVAGAFLGEWFRQRRMFRRQLVKRPIWLQQRRRKHLKTALGSLPAKPVR
ncbi:hypothetical protein [Maricaulis maris]|uniref:hypothetical protein n=1 Tax=Maricaulis maris TaxID=74318 RepID=UPI0026F15D33|nr:hypothetical protein [Maricaulis maris]